LDEEKWQTRLQEAKEKILLRKKFIKYEFRPKMGLIGSGTSNGGNVGRKFFNNSYISGDNMGIEKDYIIRDSTLLQALSSGYRTHPAKFGGYA